jgi:4'-phosphopantetheinyl transferase
MSSIVSVWTVLLDHCGHCLEEMVGALPDDEQGRARRYLRREDRERFVVARMLIRRLCGAYFRLEPRAVPLRQSSLGKPYVAQEGWTGQHRLEFNISHSGNCVILVWTEGGPVGVDVEAVERLCRGSFTEIARSAFSSDECAALASVKPEDSATTFCRIWVRKEAILKAEGCGISGALQYFSVAFRSSHGVRWPDEIVFPPSARIWSIFDFNPAPGHAASAAVPVGCLFRNFQLSRLSAHEEFRFLHAVDELAEGDELRGRPKSR